MKRADLLAKLLSKSIRSLSVLLTFAVAGHTFAQQRYQAGSLSQLTELPIRDDGAANVDQQKPNRRALRVAETARIKPPFAWKRTDKYVAPDFDGFFPDDPEAGKQLDALFTGQLGGHHKPDDVLAAVRQGLRRTKVYQNQLLGQIGSFVWGVKEQDPRAVELLYHASDPRSHVTHEGMYYGLTVLKNRTPNVMRTLINHYDAYGGNLQQRIQWGIKTYGDSRQVTANIEQLLSKPADLTDTAVVAAIKIYEESTGESYPKIAELADRGMFVVAFSHESFRNEQALRRQFENWIEKNWIQSFVVRVDGGIPVGVGLIRGIGPKNKIINRIENDKEAKLVFAETFSPTVLQRRQLRDFAEYLPDGLPEGARPPYKATPLGEFYAWNATDKYHPPDYENYFPNDPAAGKKLEQLYAERETTTLSAREQLEIFRDGLKTGTRVARMSGWAAGLSGWPDDPLAKEIFYHAADPNAPHQTIHNAVYFGLSGNWDKPPNVLRLFADILVRGPHDRNFAYNTGGRITWSLTTPDQKATVAKHINAALKNHKKLVPEKLAQLTQAYEQLTNKQPLTFDQYADRGEFAVVFFHKSNPTPIAAKEFSDVFLKDQEFVDRVIVGSTGQIKGTVMAVVKGQRGINRALKLIGTNERIQIVSVGPLSAMKGSPAWSKAMKQQGYIEPIPSNYAQAFRDLYETLRVQYSHFAVKQIDWKAVGDELLPKSETLKSRDEFCLLCMELVARLEDSHARLISGHLEPTRPAFPMWNSGFACLLGADDELIVYHVGPKSPAQLAGLQAGMQLLSLNGQPIDETFREMKSLVKKYFGYSSNRYIEYDVAHWVGRQLEKDTKIELSVVDPNGNESLLIMSAQTGAGYLPRLPVPIDGINDSANVDWKRIDETTGYIYVRRIRPDLIAKLDEAVNDLSSCRALIIDVRGNSGGGFDASRSFRNFDLNDETEPNRPRFKGPVAVLIDSRCVSAGEGWISWFRANERARFFGVTTAGASSRKNTIDVLGGAYRVIFSVKAYRGFLDRPIERRGIEPDAIVHHTATSIADGHDRVMEAAKRFLDIAVEKEQPGLRSEQLKHFHRD